MTLIMKHSSVGTSFNWTDVVCLFVTGTFESTSPSTKMLVVYVTAAITFWANSLVVISLILKQKFINFSVRIVTNVDFFIGPIFMPFVCNCFTKTYTLSATRKYTIPLTFVLVIHIFMLIKNAVMCIFSSRSHLRIINPIVCRNQKQALILLFYLICQIHMGIYINDEYRIAQVILLLTSIGMIIYEIFYPIYTYRSQNCALLTLILYNMFGSCIMLTIPDQRFYGLLLIVPSLIISVFVYYVAYPYIFFPRFKAYRFEIAYLCDDKENIMKELDNFSPKGIKQIRIARLRNMLLAAIHYQHPKLQQIAKAFSQLSTSEWRDRFILWSLSEIPYLAEGKLPQFDQKLLDDTYNSVFSQEKQLWLCAWLNYYVILPNISAKIGHAKAVYNSLIDLFHENYPMITDFGHPKFENDGLNKRVKRTFISFDIFIKILIILFTFLHFSYLTVIRTESNHMTNTVKVQYLVEAVANYQINYWTNSAAKSHMESIFTSYSEIEKAAEKFGSLREFLNRNYNGLSVRNAFTDLRNYVKTKKGNETEVFGNVFMALNLSLYNFPEICFNETNQDSLDKITKSVRINIAVLIVLLLIDTLFFIGFRKNMIASFDKFYSVPREVYLKLGGLQPTYDNKYSIPYRPSIYDSLSYIATTIFFLSFSFILGIFTLNALSDRYLVLRDMDTQYTNIKAITSVERIISLLTYSVKQSVITNDYRMKRQIFTFYEVDSLFCEIHHKSEFDPFVRLIDPNFLQLMGRYYLSSYENVNVSGFSSCLKNTIKNMDINTNQILTWKRFYISRFVTFIVNIICFVILFNVINWIIRPFVAFETLEIRSILNKVDKDVKFIQQRIQFSNVNQNALIEDSDLQMFVVGKDGTILFQTSSVNLSIQNSYNIIDSSLNQEVKQELMQYIDQYKNEYLPHSNYLTNSQYIVNPHYDFIGQKLELSYVLVINSLSHIKEKSFITKKIDQLSVCSYVSFMKGQQTYGPNGRHTIVAIVKIPEFDQPDVDIKKLMKARCAVTNKLYKLYAVNQNYCRLREEGSLIIMTLNRDADTTPWNMHTLGAEFMRKFRDMIKKVADSLKFEMKPVVLLYRCHDTVLAVSNDRMAMAAFDCPFEFAALERISKCLRTSINYTPEKTETRPQSLTKVRSCVTERGDNYDIFVVV
ncbi:hypothetical protein TVAG_003740 [Trichomonas vaginalis G3]|uniref:Uncharacterized protein n=1 Tax=Trichomonas vaginalis (strain ATCC PRA-98 / G3) TaxID=412133 RepID=A2E588_TRIV3|nr:hypothetical protein TVAGG3_0475790 [Trichomonas vaginalis G3]EAY12168.1 hypothetical protein TVAG_003740 [Trichomonas vaginalis G3]KAI5515389.1 hypothetical protein TVAGG3_0475790 [Trichomonas vaginalis G3]|eukprot:XP_001324391.1 hypothetical protein [Trichomonas vaginalis G3]